MGLWPLEFVNYFSAGIDFRRHNLTSTDVRFWRIKTLPALKGYTIAISSRDFVKGEALLGSFRDCVTGNDQSLNPHFEQIDSGSEGTILIFHWLSRRTQTTMEIATAPLFRKRISMWLFQLRVRCSMHHSFPHNYALYYQALCTVLYTIGHN